MMQHEAREAKLNEDSAAGELCQKADEFAAELKSSYWAVCEDAEKLGHSHKLKLGFMLNYSVFLYANQMRVDEARQVAKRTFDEVLADFPHMSNYK